MLDIYVSKKIFLGPPDCDKLCAEADLLLAKSHEKEKDGDLVMAALLCDSAAGNYFSEIILITNLLMQNRVLCHYYTYPSSLNGITIIIKVINIYL